ncbi:hypothetical protein N9T73_00240, partial [bacterium]|nr:hypothetical protein [bacterium]
MDSSMVTSEMLKSTQERFGFRIDNNARNIISAHFNTDDLTIIIDNDRNVRGLVCKQFHCIRSPYSENTRQALNHSKTHLIAKENVENAKRGFHEIKNQMTTFKNIFPMRVQTILTEMLSYTNVNQAIQIEKRVDNERPIYIRYVPWNMIAVYHKKVFAYVTSYMTVNNLKFAPIYYHDIYD